MVLSSRDSMVKINGNQSMKSTDKQLVEPSDFLGALRSYEMKNRRLLTATEIQKLELDYNEFVMNYFVYHQQSNTVAEYEDSFLQLKRWTDIWNEEKLDEDWVVSRFVAGLKEEIGKRVKLGSPDSLQRAIVLAKWQELCLADKVFERSLDQNLDSNGYQIKEVTNSENRKEATYHEATAQDPVTQVDFTCPLSLIYSCHPYVCSIPFISSALVINGCGRRVFDAMLRMDKNSWKSELGESSLYWGERGKLKSIVVPYLLNSCGWTTLSYAQNEEKINLEVAKNLRNQETRGAYKVFDEKPKREENWQLDSNNTIKEFGGTSMRSNSIDNSLGMNGSEWTYNLETLVAPCVPKLGVENQIAGVIFIPIGVFQFQREGYELFKQALKRSTIYVVPIKPYEFIKLSESKHFDFYWGERGKAFELRSQINAHDQGGAKVVVAATLDINKIQFSYEVEHSIHYMSYLRVIQSMQFFIAWQFVEGTEAFFGNPHLNILAFKRNCGLLIFGIQELKGVLVYISKSYNILKFLFEAVQPHTCYMPFEFIVDVLFLYKGCYTNRRIQIIKGTIFDGFNTNANGGEKEEINIEFWKTTHWKYPVHGELFFLRFLYRHDFEGKNGLVFINGVALSALYANLCVEFYLCTKWNHGGFSPWWLHFILGVQFPTEMKSLNSKIYVNESSTMPTSVNSALSWVLCLPLNCIGNIGQNEMPPGYTSQKLQKQVHFVEGVFLKSEFIDIGDSVVWCLNKVTKGQAIKGIVEGILSVMVFFVNISLVFIDEIHPVNDFCRGALHAIVNRIKMLLLNLGTKLSTPALALVEESRVVELTTRVFSYHATNSRQRIMGNSSFLKHMPLWLHQHVDQRCNRQFATMQHLAQFHLEGKVDFKGGSIVTNYFSRVIFGNSTLEIKPLV